MRIYNDFVFGLHWSTLDKSKRKAISLAKGDGVEPVGSIILSNDQKEQVIGLSEIPTSTKNYSAAAFIAKSRIGQSSPLSAFLFPIQDEIFGLICLIDSLPVSGYDIVGSKEDAMNGLEDFMQFASSQGSVSLYGVDIQGAVFYNFWDHVSQELPGIVAKDISLVPLFKLSKNVVKIAAFAIIGGAALVGYTWYSNYQKEQELIEAQRQAALRQASVKSPRQLFEEGLKTFAASAPKGYEVEKMWQSLSQQQIIFGSWSRVFIGCTEKSGCIETFVPTKDRYFNWGEWNNFPAKYKVNFEKNMVEVPLQPLIRDAINQDEPLSSFVPKAEFLTWVDRIKNANIGKLTIKGPTDLANVLPYAEGPVIKLYQVDYTGPITAVTSPYTHRSFAINEFIIERSTSNNKASAFSYKGVFYVME